MSLRGGTTKQSREYIANYWACLPAGRQASSVASLLSRKNSGIYVFRNPR
ncbi:MAG: hypothetical protein GWO87_01675 [Xanthomonadaceae bacterium]|nr:hypothetical protein [Rhodospirillaceae bacterium]NIA17880.1 hypothetical protein [Xanthomonadaceae bacterium]